MQEEEEEFYGHGFQFKISLCIILFFGFFIIYNWILNHNYDFNFFYYLKSYLKDSFY